MICRMWHGRTKYEDANVYEQFLINRAIPDYTSIPGNIDVSILRWDEGDVTHFITRTHWDSESSIRAFAGEDILTAKYYPEDENFLLEFEPSVVHYKVVKSEKN